MQNSKILTVPAWVEKARSDINQFKNQLKSGVDGFKTGFSRIDHALNCLQPGLHLVAGESNLGKSAFINQLALQIVANTPNVHVMDITIDDSEFEKRCRVVANLSKIPINDIKAYRRMELLEPGKCDLIDLALEQLKRYSYRYSIVSGSDLTTTKELMDAVKERIFELNALPEPLELVVFIDSFHDIQPDSKIPPGMNPYEYTAKVISDLASDYNIPVVCTAELKKINGFRRPIVDDVRDSVKIRYKAKSIMLCYNELGLRGENADIYFLKNSGGEKIRYPVFEVHIAKNKFNNWKGRLFYEFWPEMALFVEPNKYDHIQYLKLVNSKF